MRYYLLHLLFCNKTCSKVASTNNVISYSFHNQNICICVCVVLYNYMRLGRTYLYCCCFRGIDYNIETAVGEQKMIHQLMMLMLIQLFDTTMMFVMYIDVKMMDAIYGINSDEL